MKYFQELTLLDDAEISLYFIWFKVYLQLHLALSEQIKQHGHNAIGVSFPDYAFNAKQKNSTLGNRLRLFAPDEALLHELNIGQRLTNFTDYVYFKRIHPVPANTSYAVFRRLQPKTGIERLARRRARKDTHFSFDMALQRYTNGIKDCALPYIWINSLSNKQRFPLFISKTMANNPKTGSFSSYGLSTENTVPDFR